MSWRAYWDYYYLNQDLKVALENDPGEKFTLPYLNEQNDISVCGMSKFSPDEACEFITDTSVGYMAGRSWRFPNIYSIFQQEEFCDAALVIRKWMLDTVDLLPSSLINEVDNAASKHLANREKLISKLTVKEYTDFDIPDGFEMNLAWDVYRFDILGLYDARTIVVEDDLPKVFWTDLKKRVNSAAKVNVEPQGEYSFIGNGSSGHYNVDTFQMTCDCHDFTQRGQKNGMQCKHLIAALQTDGSWERHWGQYIPKRGSDASKQ
ncbi:MAG: hypothetical protein AAF702_28090 [Chloroflexota bacterium]